MLCFFIIHLQQFVLTGENVAYKLPKAKKSTGILVFSMPPEGSVSAADAEPKQTPMLINEVEINNLQALVYGEEASFNFTLPKNDTHFHIATPEDMTRLGIGGNSTWWRVKDSSKEMIPGDHFTNTIKDNYYADVVLVPDERYTFASEPSIKFNGSIVTPAQKEQPKESSSSTVPKTGDNSHVIMLSILTLGNAAYVLV